MTGSVCIGAAQNHTSQVWQADLGDGTYRNPVLMADYSDPDVVRVGEDYYMTASSFNCTPGLPILHSKDLVNWSLAGHALPRLVPVEHYSVPQHGRGVWAPCIRYHGGEFYIYWGDPDFGIFMVKAEDPCGRWSEPVLVKEGKGLIDPSPLWDDDGRAWMVHAWAGSRAGFNSVLSVFEMNAEGTADIGGETMVFDGNDGINHTVEGPKLYKRGDWYWIFAPAGGVATGWQLAMRSKNILGPYEARMVMAQGATDINGPHQGGWVDTPSGESWFVNFQEIAAYGRVVHLNPMRWTADDWCVIGEDPDGDGIGQPVRRHRKPDTGTVQSIATPAESDEFDSHAPGLQWQWHANPQDWFGMASGYGFLRMYGYREPFDNMWSVPNLLLRKFPAEEFAATAKLRFCSKSEGDGGGLIVMGCDYARVAVTRRGEEGVVEFITCRDADKGSAEERTEVARIPLCRSESGAVPLYDTDIWFRVEVGKGAKCVFSYSTDGKRFRPMGAFTAHEGRWIGAKVGLHVVNSEGNNERGWLDADRFTITKLQ